LHVYAYAPVPRWCMALTVCAQRMHQRHHTLSACVYGQWQHLSSAPGGHVSTSSADLDSILCLEDVLFHAQSHL